MTAAILLVVLTACEKYDYNPYADVLLKTGSGLMYKYSDFELYDSSTHILYFRNNHPEFKNEEVGNFSVLADGKEIYQGFFLPGYSSSIPAGPVISSTQFFYQNFLLRIDSWYLAGSIDLRNDTRIIEVLKERDLLHSGLSIMIDPLEFNDLDVAFKFTVTNHDKSDLLILDINKTGPYLFHYFTNGLRIVDSGNREVFTSNIEYQAPEPWNSWKNEWLSLIKSGESRQFTIHYTLNSPLGQGEYTVFFEFPGLGLQVSREQLYQDGNRIWLGDVMNIRHIRIQ